ALPTHRAQASGSFSADGSPAPAPQAKCTKTADPDPKILPACKPPPIRDGKIESANPRYGEGVFSKLLVLGPGHEPIFEPTEARREHDPGGCEHDHAGKQLRHVEGVRRLRDQPPGSRPRAEPLPHHP